MTIGVYGRALSNRAGIGRYARELLRAMLAEPRGHRIQIFAADASPAFEDPEFQPHAVSIGRSRHRIVEEQIALVQAVRRSPVDLYFCPDFTLPLALPRTLKAAVSVHDVSYVRLPESNSRNSRLLLNTFVPIALRRASVVITGSTFSKQEIVDVYGTPPNKIEMIPDGVEPRFNPPSIEDATALRQKYALPTGRIVLVIGTIEPRKNLERLAAAVSMLPNSSLVIVGGDARNAVEIRASVGATLGDRARFLGYVPDDEMPALYGVADVFAYPSLYEGFGLQPLEAMGVGTPVAVSSAGPMPEVSGDAAVRFDPYSVESIHNALERVLSDLSLRRTLIARGFERAAELSWRACAARTLELFERITA